MVRTAPHINNALPASAFTTRTGWRRLLAGGRRQLRTPLLPALVIAGAALLQPQLAAAQTSYAFGSTAVDAFGAGPYGSVTLAQSFSDVLVSVSLRDDLNFVHTGSHAIFAFNLSGLSSSSDITKISFAKGLNNVFGVVNAPGNSPFSTFSYGITCIDDCSAGGSRGGYADPLTFTVHNAMVSDFNQLSTGKGRAAYFSADVANGTGTTGTIGVTQISAVPEPESYAMLLAGLGLMGSIALRRQRRKP